MLIEILLNLLKKEVENNRNSTTFSFEGAQSEHRTKSFLDVKQ